MNATPIKALVASCALALTLAACTPQGPPPEVQVQNCKQLVPHTDERVSEAHLKWYLSYSTPAYNGARDEWVDEAGAGRVIGYAAAEDAAIWNTRSCMEIFT